MSLIACHQNLASYGHCMIRERIFGTRSNGQIIRAFELESDQGFRAVVLDQGAILNALYLPDGRNVALGFENWDQYETDAGYIGRIIGRNANRIVDARFQIDSESFKLDPNDTPHNLHSGPNGFDAQTWEVERTQNELVLRHSSPDGHDGFPGEVDTELKISLRSNCLRLDMEAITSKPTAINLTWHPYWNLSSQARIDGHDLEVKSDHRTDLQSQDPMPLEQTRFDFRQSLPIGSVKIDDNYTSVSSATLATIDTRLHVTSSLPDMQIYTGDNLQQPRSGIAMEPQIRPNDINHDQASLLRPGEIYQHWIEYHFEMD